MNHEEIKDKLAALYDGELPESEQGALRSHIGQCPECREEYRGWERIATSLFQAPEVKASESFAEEVMVKIEALEEPVSAPDWGGLARWLVSAFALGSVALFLFLSTPNGEMPVTTETLLLANGFEGATSEWMFYPEAPDSNELLGYTLETP